VNAREILAKGVASRRSAQTRMAVAICIAVAVASFIFGYTRPSGGVSLWAGLQGVVNALLAAVPLIVFELKTRPGAALSWLRRLPLFWFFTIKVAVYLVVFVTTIVVARALLGDLVPQPAGFGDRFREILIFASLVSVIINLAVEIGALVGFATLRRLLTGRYLRPRREELVFAVVDMAGSTSAAERLGDLEFHALLNAFFADIGEAAHEYGAEIHKYIGDEAILSWPITQGLRESRAALCVFAAARNIERRTEWYRGRFGLTPSFRAALHIGTVAAGEIGQQRREIAYVGDTLNTAARLLDAARDAGRDVVVSRALLDRLSLPDGLLVEPLPPADAAGKREKVPLAALSLV